MKIALCLFLVFYAVAIPAQTHDIQWNKCFGGNGDEDGASLIPTSDGGFIMAATTQSSDIDTLNYHGDHDAWIIKLDSNFGIEWDKCYGGTGKDGSSSIIQTSDGGFLFSGTTNSSDGDIIGLHGAYDTWLTKIDSKGDIKWTRCYGGAGDDFAGSISMTPDGGFIFWGNTTSSDVVGFHGGFRDVWITKIDSLGSIQWTKCYGGSDDDFPMGLIQIEHGGFVFWSWTESSDGDVTGLHGHDIDPWVVKLADDGSIVWQNCYGGSSYDHIYDFIATKDSGFIMAVEVYSVDGDIAAGCRDPDAWIVKLNSEGTIDWQSCLGSEKNGSVLSIIETSDLGYLLMGSILLGAGPDHSDAFVVKLKNGGSVEWQQNFGGKNNDICYNAIETQRGYLLVAETNSRDGDVSGYHNGPNPSTNRDSNDVWFLQVNKAGKIEWEKCFGGTAEDKIRSFIQVRSGEYIFLGFTESLNGDIINFHGGKDVWILNVSPKAGANKTFPVELQLSTFPNPSHHILTLAFTLQFSEQEIQLKASNIQGELVEEIKLSSLHEGYHEVALDLSSNPTGKYFITLSGDNFNATTSIELVK